MYTIQLVTRAGLLHAAMVFDQMKAAGYPSFEAIGGEP
jgi:hypothetical protein